ncbi:phosphomannomutase [Thalassotalea sp. LPB0316]|uniref:phosphomannomutase n=1 Tax=Thalassotalea sp. LPB0316 TaxID=2769490 RepID=UPI001868644A|nr:phosphomannomutase [Thalassotalea sp. LPB0316]QOL24425.1 phosphomannomutase [Thalassotalea sp. LPB0316]
MLVSNKVINASGVAFGTSGARGLVTQFTNDVCAAFTHAFIDVMLTRFSFERVALGIDNRPSSLAMAKACATALQQKGIEPVYCGVLPTPGLAYMAMQQAIPCIMVTGSHIPFDRNGLKFYRPDGEISKGDEQAILNAQITFDSIEELVELTTDSCAANMYVQRYTSMFENNLLQGKRIGIYEHSSAGRELYADLFSALGAEVVSLERSDEFVPIDTEAVAEEDFVKARKWAGEYKLDAIFSTDGDGDRPLISDEHGEWLRGDVLGLLCAQALGIEALAIPVNCNTVIEASGKFTHVTRTRIGSPYVIAEFDKLTAKYIAVAGFEANGGFLLGSDVTVNGKVLKALPTRDAVLPAIMLLALAGDKSISAVVETLPKRFTSSDRIKNFATEKSKKILASGTNEPEVLLAKLGFNTELQSVDVTDGLRMTFMDGRIIHLRPSGNAPELRCYAEADELLTAQRLVKQSLDNVQKLG